eukprot:Tbor_TRINITY_DN5630_c4_g10::TRINITY_DN5630_c4_g10_i1::g.8419::m.8419
MSHAPHVGLDALKKLSLPLLSRHRGSLNTPHIDVDKSMKHFNYPLVGYNMWRGNHNKYKYTKSSLSHWGEGSSNAHKYHQHYSHAKCKEDYGKGGREFEYMKVLRGRRVVKPLPIPQYTGTKGATFNNNNTSNKNNNNNNITWLFKSWHGSLANNEIWQREVQYNYHIPEHLGVSRPLCTLAPRTFHRSLHNVYMEKITIIICPFMFGYGTSIQEAVMGFYRRALSARSPIPNDRIVLVYSIDMVTPSIEVQWVDGSVYRPPILEGCTAQDIIQMVMEQAWVAGDIIGARGVGLQPLAIDDYKWLEMALTKRKKKVADTKGKK